jgi:hypothetical protein
MVSKMVMEMIIDKSSMKKRKKMDIRKGRKWRLI